jgi:mono/diheme cytochrome c family protein
MNRLFARAFYAGTISAIIVLFTATLGVSIVRGQAAVAPAAGMSTNDGIYSAAQADRGQKLFEARCTTCHDAARFTGAEFTKAWVGQPMHELFDLVKATMPEDNPGSLQPQQYADVLSYFLKLNKFPAGENELKGTDEAMKVIRFDALKPPKR